MLYNTIYIVKFQGGKTSSKGGRMPPAPLNETLSIIYPPQILSEVGGRGSSQNPNYSKLLSCINFLLRNYRDFLAIIQGYHPFEWDEWIFTIAKVS